MRAYLTTLTVAFLAAMALVAATNRLIDPWNFFPDRRLQGLRRPQAEAHARLFKDVQAWTRTFDTVYLGSSRVDVGMPVLSANDFNLAYPGGNLEESLRLADYLARSRKARTILIGLDFDRFKEPGELNLEAHLEAIDGAALPFSLEIAKKYLLTFEAFSDSLKTVVKNVRGSAYDVHSPGGQRSVEYMEALRGNAPSPEVFERFFAEEESVMRNFRLLDSKFALLENFCRKAAGFEARIELVVLPYHESWHRYIEAKGLSATFEAWIDRLQNLEPCRAHATLHDRRRLEEVSSEPIAGKARDMRYFWDPTHFKSAAGERLLSSIAQHLTANR